MATEKQYHVFATGYDQWHSTLKEAQDDYESLGDVDKRLYEETYVDEELENEECLESNGNYPF